MDISYEKGEEKIDVREKLAAGIGEVNKFSSWALRAKAWACRFGAEENGIERIPPEARIKQNPLGMSITFHLLTRPILLFHELRDRAWDRCSGTERLRPRMV